MVPLTMVTGALGVGKTSALLELAAHRPEHERWVVLVNELGEVGIDGAMLRDDGGIEVAELPGGCLCCATRGPLLQQVASVVSRLKPDRLLVEPSGVAEPGRVLDDLAALRQVVDLRAVITLVDPRAVVDERLRRGAWQAQVDAADVLVANKVDLVDGEAVRAFLRWGEQRFPAPSVLATTVGGELDPVWLDRPAHWVPTDHRGHVHGTGVRLEPRWQDTTGLLPPELAHGLLRRAWSGPHHETCGWRLAPHLRFAKGALHDWCQAVAARSCPFLKGGALRLKGVLHTEDGWFAVQADLDGVRWKPSAWRADSRVEIIGPAHPDNDWVGIDSRLLQCLLE